MRVFKQTAIVPFSKERVNQEADQTIRSRADYSQTQKAAQSRRFMGCIILRAIRHASRAECAHNAGQRQCNIENRNKIQLQIAVCLIGNQKIAGSTKEILQGDQQTIANDFTNRYPVNMPHLAYNRNMKASFTEQEKIKGKLK